MVFDREQHKSLSVLRQYGLVLLILFYCRCDTSLSNFRHIWYLRNALDGDGDLVGLVASIEVLLVVLADELLHLDRRLHLQALNGGGSLWVELVKVNL